MLPLSGNERNPNFQSPIMWQEDLAAGILRDNCRASFNFPASAKNIMIMNIRDPDEVGQVTPCAPANEYQATRGCWDAGFDN